MANWAGVEFSNDNPKYWPNICYSKYYGINVLSFPSKLIQRINNCRLILLMELSIVVPVYRGEEFLVSLLEEMAVTLPTFANKYEVILVNDGSPDNSWQIIQSLTRKYDWVRGICFMCNYGQHNATLCGVRAARYSIVATMDQDLQYPPGELPVLLAKLEEGYDVVYGAPRKLPQSLWRNFMTASIKRILANVMGISSLKNISAFRLFRTELREAWLIFKALVHSGCIAFLGNIPFYICTG